MNNLSRVVQRLIEKNVEFVLVGGFAAAAHGSPLGTQDVDVCCPMTFENLSRIQSALEGLHPMHRSRPDLPLEITPKFCEGLKNLYLKTDHCALDCLGTVLGVGDYETVRQHVIELKLPYGVCPVLDLDTLIAAKVAMGRQHDIETVVHLKQIKNRLSKA